MTLKNVVAVLWVALLMKLYEVNSSKNVVDCGLKENSGGLALFRLAYFVESPEEGTVGENVSSDSSRKKEKVVVIVVVGVIQGCNGPGQTGQVNLETDVRVRGSNSRSK